MHQIVNAELLEVELRESQSPSLLMKPTKSGIKLCIRANCWMGVLPHPTKQE